EPAYFLSHPAHVIAVWRGGMSSHGGFIGVVITLWFALRNKEVSKLALADTVVVPIALGLALGRLGNFINYELYGYVTDLQWAIAIPGVEGLRHPTQIYAVLKDLIIAGVCFWHLRRYVKPGMTTAVFLMLYAVLRFTVEIYRVQDHTGLLGLTRGQLLTVPIFIFGVLLWKAVRKI
ncbi:MAG: prolipoprotein diacylglyceryl transferase, partial [Candidatus Peribacteraceae bacterium]|nr:prolipoprotein diacylglyceryl transferase [Candidatus Peribacteraceae bacterium]